MTVDNNESEEESTVGAGEDDMGDGGSGRTEQDTNSHGTLETLKVVSRGSLR